jgi:hypothetical protein
MQSFYAKGRDISIGPSRAVYITCFEWQNRVSEKESSAAKTSKVQRGKKEERDRVVLKSI